MPRPNKSGITPEVINEWKAKDKTDSEIAENFGVTKKHISWVRAYYGGVDKSPSEMVAELWPWDVPERFHGAAPELRLRDHLRYRANRRKPLSAERLALLRGFYNRMRKNNTVVEFDPNIPPHKGVYTGGWAYRPREESDGELLIRVNEYTKELTEEMKMVWRFPPDDPV